MVCIPPGTDFRPCLMAVSYSTTYYSPTSISNVRGA
jgi:hypothetical protein